MTYYIRLKLILHIFRMIMKLCFSVDTQFPVFDKNNDVCWTNTKIGMYALLSMLDIHSYRKLCHT